VGAEAPHRRRTNNVGKLRTYAIVGFMDKFLKTSYVVYRCEYHFVWVPKYRYQILVSEVMERLRGILTELCEWLEITIIEGAIKEDHVHLYLSVSPKYSPAHVMKVLKGKSAEYLGKEFPELSKKYWGMHMWARGYFVSTVGVNEEVIRNYIKKHQEEEIQEEQRRLWKDNSG
jgi:putative transposase